MQRTLAVKKMTTAALLIAVGIVIPMFMPFPFKIIIEPASFTLASHVPVFLAMFISPPVAVAVAAGTTLGFFFGGFPLVVVMRALTHLVFASLGAFYLQKRPSVLASPVRSQLFSLVIGIIHGVCEVLVVIPFYFGGGMAEGFYTNGFFVSVILLVGVGSIIHSMVDFLIAWGVMKALVRQRSIAALFPASVRPKTATVGS